MSYGVCRHLQQYFSFIVAVSIICGGIRSTNGKINHLMFYRVCFAMSRIRTHNFCGD